MLRVLLVDDEPFVVQGLRVFVDWNAEGFEIAATAGDGEEALEYLREHEVDLIIADIKMPGMSGLELLEKIRSEDLSGGAYFIILSGYGDFAYAQQAIRNKCMDYLLKPVEKEELLRILRKVAKVSQFERESARKRQRLEHEFLARNVISLLRGKYDDVNLEYVKSHMQLSEGVRYIYLEPCESGMEEQEDGEYRQLQRKLYNACLAYLEEEGAHCIFDVSWEEYHYDIGLLYCDYMAAVRGMSEKEYLLDLQKSLEVAIRHPVKLLAGKKVPDISSVAQSYGTVCVLNSLEVFRARKNMYFYEEEVQMHSGGIVLCKQSLDALILAIEQNDKIQIRKRVERLYEEMRQMGLAGDTVNLNINYFLFQLIHLATEQDDCVNQEEILHFIGESTFEEGIVRGSSTHLVHFAIEYAEYLTQLRKNISRGSVLADVEREIRENYAANLTLRELSQKYYVNSAYLGQLFRKKYGQSFKDYLNNYRMEQAALRLLRTNDKIYQIAQDVGYKDCDYFINRFIAAKGCTPAKFRRQGGVGEQ